MPIQKRICKNHYCWWKLRLDKYLILTVEKLRIQKKSAGFFCDDFGKEDLF
jgi:hypothetical protein